MPPTDFIRVVMGILRPLRLDAHQSWTKLLIAFIRDRHVTLFSRVVRPLH